MTTGRTGKFSSGTGVSVCHSRDFEPQGLDDAMAPPRQDVMIAYRKTSIPMPMM